MIWNHQKSILTVLLVTFVDYAFLSNLGYIYLPFSLNLAKRKGEKWKPPCHKIIMFIDRSINFLFYGSKTLMSCPSISPKLFGPVQIVLERTKNVQNLFKRWNSVVKSCYWFWSCQKGFVKKVWTLFKTYSKDEIQ